MYKIVKYNHFIDTKMMKIQEDIEGLNRLIRRSQDHSYLKKKAIEDFKVIEKGSILFVFPD
ncbi:MAG: hypothetical protein NZ480_02610 [Bdellovibrionaceae bacterium]|nr:hypothetical protein [Pseudobdellovibrionaceae bacterium]MDW8190951.1 hypothetical protein [Pseudobdellovibrionaceae bacterium]